jgi:hypothetical protein
MAKLSVVDPPEPAQREALGDLLEDARRLGGEPLGHGGRGRVALIRIQFFGIGRNRRPIIVGFVRTKTVKAFPETAYREIIRSLGRTFKPIEAECSTRRFRSDLCRVRAHRGRP